MGQTEKHSLIQAFGLGFKNSFRVAASIFTTLPTAVYKTLVESTEGRQSEQQHQQHGQSKHQTPKPAH
jgi:hypothetical protein